MPINDERAKKRGHRGVQRKESEAERYEDWPSNRAPTMLLREC